MIASGLRGIGHDEETRRRGVAPGDSVSGAEHIGHQDHDVRGEPAGRISLGKDGAG